MLSPIQPLAGASVPAGPPRAAAEADLAPFSAWVSAALQIGAELLADKMHKARTQLADGGWVHD